MLTIGKLGRGQERYYTEKVAEGAEDYYSGEGEESGYWIGTAAEELGLTGIVEAEQLTAMLTGHNPLSGEPLLGTGGVGPAGPVPGFDLTFSAPKSVSLLWALGEPGARAAVIEAHQRSLDAAIDYLQREACWTRRGAGGAEFVPGSGYLAAAFRHRTSRNGDPQLHTHVLIANATKGPDGRWSRLYHPAIFSEAKTAGYIYEAQLRHELSRELGVRWRDVRNGIAEIEGFEDAHLREFASRRQQILEAAGGPDASARARQVANLTTRGAKEDVSRADLLERWRDKARQVGLHPETIAATLDREGAMTRTVLGTEQLDRAVTAKRSHFERREAIQAVADSLPHGAPGAEVERLADDFLASGAVIAIAESAKGERFTTRRVWELERSALAAAERMRAQGPSPAGELIAARVIASRPTLKDDQAKMVGRLLVERSGLAIVIGEAGTGKTYATLAAAEGWAQAGIEIHAAAPTWRAANVLRAEGLAASSLARLLAELDRTDTDDLPRGSVLLVDEAGMVDSASLARLIDHADRAEAKLVLIGDPAQLGEIEAGGLFSALVGRSEPVVLDQVIRHNHELDREAAKRIRRGEGSEALDLYRSEQRVIVAPNAEARREAILADWHRSFDRGEDAVMIAKRNVEVERLNAMAREVRRQARGLGDVEIAVGEASFAIGDQVITRVNDRRQEIYNRQRWTVAEVDAEARSVVLDGIDTQGRVCVDATYLERVNPYNEAPALQHAYAVTTYCAQGNTVDRAYVLADPSMDKQELYVAASRSREETWLYATPEIQTQREEYAPRSPHTREAIPQIAEAAGRDRAQAAAHDVALDTKFSRLPSEELVARRSELLPAAQREQALAERRATLQKRISATRERLAGPEAPRRQRMRELARADAEEALSRRALTRLEGELEAMPEPRQSAGAELAALEQALAARRRLAITAARLTPPDYIAKELGERPEDPAKRKVWERGVEAIESYRQGHGVKNQDHALGIEPTDRAERGRREAQLRRLRHVQRELGREVGLGQARELGIGR